MSTGKAAASCTLTPDGLLTDVPVARKCTVTYTFDTRASEAPALAIPYAVEVNGAVLPEFVEKPRSLGSDRKITLKVNPGAKVALYLNSDARQGYRTHPVYAVEVGSRDVQIAITERLGRGNTESAKLGAFNCIQTADGKRFDQYDATLTGDIWLKISHRYTREEAAEILPGETDPIVRAAVLSIYSPLLNQTLVINFPASGTSPAQVISLSFMEQQSVSANISYCPLLSHVLTRTHPNCYLAIITEARAAGTTTLRIISAWRPLLGSIAHRAGLALDVDYMETPAGKLSIERKSLTSKTQKSGNNVTPKEKELFEQYQSKEREEKQRKDEAKILEEAAKRSPQNSELVASSLAAKVAAENALKELNEARENWKKAVATYEPAAIRSLRAQLSARQDVRQILDPWYVDLNTKDGTPGMPNEQHPGVEKGHNNHLHITIIEAKIL